MNSQRETTSQGFRFRPAAIVIGVHTALVLAFALYLHLAIDPRGADVLMGWHLFVIIDYPAFLLLPGLEGANDASQAASNMRCAVWFALVGAIQWGGLALLAEALLWEARRAGCQPSE